MSIELDQDYGPYEISPSNSKSKDPRYPSFHYEGDEELDLPEEGEMTVTFRVKTKSERRDSEGNCTYSYDIEVCTIEDVNGEDVEDTDDDEQAGGKSYDVASEALDKIAEALKGSK